MAMNLIIWKQDFGLKLKAGGYRDEGYGPVRGNRKYFWRNRRYRCSDRFVPTRLKGLGGVTLALPVLDAKGAEVSDQVPRRFCAIYTANGMSLPKRRERHS